MKKFKPAPAELVSPHVSVVLTVHNEAESLRDNLVYLLEQDYPDFDVVVVDYRSTDDTNYVLKVLGENYPNLKPVIIKEDVTMFKGNKYPLSIGIQSAADGIVLLTESDCRPASFNWLQQIVSSYLPSTQIVLGYSGIKAGGKGLLSLLAQYDNIAHSAHYLSAAIAGCPYTGNGRNLSYRRKFFFDKGAFFKHYVEPDGADDLFVNANAKGGNTAINIERDAWMEIEPYRSFHSWRDYRIHRFSTKKYYKPLQFLTRLVAPVSLVLFVAAILAMLLHQPLIWPVAVGAVVLKMAWQTVCVWKWCKRLEVKLVGWLSPFFEFYFLFSDTIIFLSSLFLRKRIR
ncbi:MAG: glycosyltransferase [Bacteroidales bacterium]|nr:glycosyltransferase [Bacteroidales bacterium]